LLLTKKSRDSKEGALIMSMQKESRNICAEAEPHAYRIKPLATAQKPQQQQQQRK